MSFRSRSSAFVIVAAAIILGGANLSKLQPLALDHAPTSVPTTSFIPGSGTPPPEDPHEGDFRHDPNRIAEGKRLYTWYNCGGCHFNGAGGIGPALMDDQWTYGNRIDQIYASIYQGRPNGMPSWGEKLADAEIWEIAAYVLNLAETAPPLEPALKRP
jgi:cytochrome c oxidase cbb3-type subunit 3